MRDHVEDWLRVHHLAMDCFRTKKKNKQILELTISKERNMCLLPNAFSHILLESMENIHPVFTDGSGTRYPMTCRFLALEHHIHSSMEKSLLLERIKQQYIKDRTNECFDDYFPCRMKNCKMKHVSNWLNLFVDYHNKELKSVN